MNRQEVTTAIVLARTDYGEADRIVTVLTPNHGKLRLMAKGVRKVKSKLAGGVELFSISSITFIRGRGDIGTLVSARLETHYGHIVENIDRTMLGYELIKQLHKATEDEPEQDYFALLQTALASLNDATISTDIIRVWFTAQLLRLSGHTPNLHTELEGVKLQADKAYEFDFESSSFMPRVNGQFGADAIKFLRLLFQNNSPKNLWNIAGSTHLLALSRPLVIAMAQQYL